MSDPRIDTDPWMHIGVPRDLWLDYHDKIVSLVKEYKLTPMATRISAAPNAPTATMLPMQFLSPKGGMRTPHFHLGDDVYRVDAKAWDEFTAHVKRDLSRKIGEAGRMSFGQLADLDVAVNNLA